MIVIVVMVIIVRSQRNVRLPRRFHTRRGERSDGQGQTTKGHEIVRNPYPCIVPGDAGQFLSHVLQRFGPRMMTHDTATPQTEGIDEDPHRGDFEQAFLHHRPPVLTDDPSIQPCVRVRINGAGKEYAHAHGRGQANVIDEEPLW